MSHKHRKHGYQIAPAELAGVQSFVNTADWEEHADALADVDKVQVWLCNRQWISANSAVDQRDLQRLIQLREALRAMLTVHTLDPGAPYPPQTVATFNTLSSGVGLQVMMSEAGEVYLARGHQDADAVLATLVGAVFAAISNGYWRRLKACRNPLCRWIFYDYSRNRAGVWCDMASCGARHKVRAYRQRKAASHTGKSNQ